MDSKETHSSPPQQNIPQSCNTLQTQRHIPRIVAKDDNIQLSDDVSNPFLNYHSEQSPPNNSPQNSGPTTSLLNNLPPQKTHTPSRTTEDDLFDDFFQTSQLEKTNDNTPGNTPTDSHHQSPSSHPLVPPITIEQFIDLAQSLHLQTSFGPVESLFETNEANERVGEGQSEGFYNGEPYIGAIGLDMEPFYTRHATTKRTFTQYQNDLVLLSSVKHLEDIFQNKSLKNGANHGENSNHDKKVPSKLNQTDWFQHIVFGRGGKEPNSVVDVTPKDGAEAPRMKPGTSREKVSKKKTNPTLYNTLLLKDPTDLYLKETIQTVLDRSLVYSYLEDRNRKIRAKKGEVRGEQNGGNGQDLITTGNTGLKDRSRSVNVACVATDNSIKDLIGVEKKKSIYSKKK